MSFCQSQFLFFSMSTRQNDFLSVKLILFFSSSNLQFVPKKIFKLPKFSRASLLVFLSFKCSILSLFLFFKLLITGSISSFGDWAAGNRWTEIAMRMIMTNSVLKSTTVNRNFCSLKKSQITKVKSFSQSLSLRVSGRQNQYQSLHRKLKHPIKPGVT